MLAAATPAGIALASIETSALGAAMRDSAWLYPAAEIAHLVGVALLFGTVAVLDLRLLGFGRSLPVRRLTAHVLPWTLASFLLIVPSGLAMFAAYATDLIENPVFTLKIVLIALAGCNAAIYFTGPFQSVAQWETSGPPVAARITAGVSLALWMTVIACGRLLGYT